MSVITLNDTFRNIARANPVSLLTIVTAYSKSGLVNQLDLEEIEKAIDAAKAHAMNIPTLHRDQFDTDEAYTDQTNQLVIINAIATTLSQPFEADNVPGMIEELFQRIESDPETHAAYHGISESSRRLEEAFMNKAKAELY